METAIQQSSERKRRKPYWHYLHWHLVGWGIYYIFTFSHNHYRYDDPADWLMVLLIAAIVMPCYYLMAYVLHRYVRKDNWWRGIMMLLGLFPLACGYAYLWVFPGFRAMGIHWPIHDLPFNLLVFSMAIGIYYARILFYAMMIEAVRRAIEHFREKLRIANRHAATLDALLRFQINGHFQFNVLNSVAVSAANRGSMPQYQMMMALSKLQRYSMEIAESRLALVDIHREIEALQDLVVLAVAQHDGEQVMVCEVTGAYMGQFVPPAALLTVADNMLKFGRMTESDPGKLLLEFQASGFVFTTRNRIDDDKVRLCKGSGLGLKNLENRLQLLFPNQYRLAYGVQDDYYELSLFVTYADGKNS